MNYPFFAKSTPSWSQRGLIRTNIFSILEKWDSRITGSLFSLSDTIKDLHIILDHFVDSYINKTVTTFINGIYEYYFTFDHIVDIPKINLFWKIYLTKLCKNATPSIKSLDNLILKLKNWNNTNSMKITLKVNIEIIFTQNKCKIIYKI